MLEYLDAYWERRKSDEIASMLGGMFFLNDGVTFDQACWSDWEAAWAKTSGKNKADYLMKLTK